MAGISHRVVDTNGISMRIAEAGSGPLVILCHGFPESWYSWRHQIAALSAAGYHVVAPDQRGYGGTDAPAEIDGYTLLHLVGDIVGLVAALGEETAVIVGHDWGSPVAWTSAMMRPDVFTAVASLSVPTSERGAAPPMASAAKVFGDRFFYQLYFQTPGIAEHELQNNVAVTMRKMLVGASGARPRSTAFERTNAPPASSFMLEFMEDPGDDLPAWLTAEDIDYFTGEFSRGGFRGGLNWYRNSDRNWSLLGAFQGRKIEQPELFVAGEADVVPFGPEAEAAMRSKVPNLTAAIVLPGIGHWTQQEAPDEVNAVLLAFLAGL
jgi:pimeloyl-ACP methyl ester carboxylesterase